MLPDDKVMVPEVSPSPENTNLSQIKVAQKDRRQDEHRYTMRISRRTVDKLGVKLYDRASAVVAELVANAYDADAESVRVRLPLASLLGTRQGTPGHAHQDANHGLQSSVGHMAIALGKTQDILETQEDYGHAPDSLAESTNDLIEVRDNGHGMDPAEADKHFLTVGQDRRINPRQGPLSRNKQRPVMGRKGIGKLAPFGICTRIEVISSGGVATPNGYLTSHFILDYNEIIQDTEESYYPERGAKDRTYSHDPGTTIRLSAFQRKRVPDQETFMRQLARRFGAQQSDFKIVVEDTRDPKVNPPTPVMSVDIPVVDSTRIELSTRPVLLDEGATLPVIGWIGMAQQGYKHEELAGVRIYARNKIVATTRDFGLMSGFTGENTLRSYLVGEIHAEWLDEDSGEDLIKTDRQDILWESDRGHALRSWGQDLLKEIGTLSRAPRRQNVRNRFLRLARVRERARARYTDETVVASAVELAGIIGGFAAEDELTDEVYVDGLCEVILSVAPHRALMNAFHDFKTRIDPSDSTLESLLDLFDKTRVAELASYSQIAMERVTIIEQLSGVVDEGAPEPELQKLISKGPWLIDPTWSVITKNQSLRTFARRYVAIWQERHGEALEIALIHDSKRPDFTAMEVAGRLRIVELKAPKHKFGSQDFIRLQNYVLALRHLFAENKSMGELFSNGWQIDLVADQVALPNHTEFEAFCRFEEKKEVVRITWTDFIVRAEQTNSKFLDIRHASQIEAARLQKAPS